MPFQHINLISVSFLALLGWRVYARFRRNIGRQPLSPHRLTIRLCIYVVIVLAFIVIAIINGPVLPLLGSLGGGILLGIPVAFYGLHLTQYEATPNGKFYTPNPIMGVCLTLLLAARLGYRIVTFQTEFAQEHPGPHVFQSPLTMFLFGLLAGYYIAYYTGLILHDDKKPAVVL